MTGIIITAIIGIVGSLGVGYLAYKGADRTASASKDASTKATHVDAQESALVAWQGLLEPYRQEVAQLREELTAERDDRAKKDQLDAKNRETEKRAIAQQITKLTERIDLQAKQIEHWKRLARTIAKFAASMRDEVLRLGGTVPATPEELLLIQSIDDDDL